MHFQIDQQILYIITGHQYYIFSSACAHACRRHTIILRFSLTCDREKNVGYNAYFRRYRYPAGGSNCTLNVHTWKTVILNTKSFVRAYRILQPCLIAKHTWRMEKKNITLFIFYFFFSEAVI